MLKTSLRKVGGSVMLAVPPALLEQLHLTTDNTLMIGIEGNKLVVEAAKPHYTLEELLAQCDPNVEFSDEDKTWINIKPVGQEIL